MHISVAVLGAGSWGTTVASLAAQNTDTVLWARDPEVAAEVETEHTNRRYLPGFELHPTLRASADLAEVVSATDVLVMGVPSQAFRDTLEEAAPHLRAWVPVVSLTKGFERGTGRRMTEVVAHVVPGHPYGVLTGPNLAKEILTGQAAAAVIAMSDDTIAARLQDVFSSPMFRVYRNSDVIGAELGGALKNVIAIASGMALGLGTGDNTRAAVITRGLAEITRLGVAMGGRPETFAGLAGMGDLMATCLSTQSRNRHVGEQLGRGRTIEEVVADMNQVAEGVKTAEIVVELAERHGIEMPISADVHAVVNGRRTATDVYKGLMSRAPRAETDPE